MKDFKKWEKEKELIPKMILIYCRNKHKKKRKSISVEIIQTWFIYVYISFLNLKIVLYANEQRQI